MAVWPIVALLGYPLGKFWTKYCNRSVPMIVTTVVCLLLLAVESKLTSEQVKVWKTELSFYSHELQVDEQNKFALNDMARTLLKHGSGIDKALELLDQRYQKLKTPDLNVAVTYVALLSNKLRWKDVLKIGGAVVATQPAREAGQIWLEMAQGHFFVGQNYGQAKKALMQAVKSKEQWVVDDAKAKLQSLASMSAGSQQSVLEARKQKLINFYR